MYFPNKAIGGAIMVASMLLSGCAATPPPASPARIAHNQLSAFPVAINHIAPQPLMVGETVRLWMLSGVDGFAQLYLLRASGDVLVLAEDMPVTARVARDFPGDRDGFSLRATPPAGTDQVVLLVTRAPFASGLAGATAQQGPTTSLLDREGFVHRLNARLAGLPTRDWATAIIPIEIMNRR